MKYREMGIIDPLMYVAKIKRDKEGKIRKLTLLYDGESTHINDGDEFVTFVTSIALETWVKS